MNWRCNWRQQRDTTPSPSTGSFRSITANASRNRAVTHDLQRRRTCSTIVNCSSLRLIGSDIGTELPIALRTRRGMMASACCLFMRTWPRRPRRGPFLFILSPASRPSNFEGVM